jgi:hypothetical protein
MENKIWYASKILWVNLIALIGMVLQGKFGYVLSPEIQVVILALINMILRAITKQEIVWSKSKLNKA